MFYQDIMSKNTGLGNPEFFGAGRQLSYSRFNAEIIIEKNASVIFIFLKFIPVFLSALGLCLVFFITANRLRKRLLIIMITFSISIIFYLRQLAALPVGYITVIDYAYFTVFMLIVIAALVSALTYRQQKN